MFLIKERADTSSTSSEILHVTPMPVKETGEKKSNKPGSSSKLLLQAPKYMVYKDNDLDVAGSSGDIPSQLRHRLIRATVINEMKCVLEGSETCTNRKFGDGFNLPRTPVVALSNYDPWQFCPTEKDTLLNRMKHYRFGLHSSNAKYDTALNPLLWKVLKDMYKPVNIKAKDLFF